jgi:hypothetical protein
MSRKTQFDKAIDHALREFDRVGDLDKLPRAIRTVAIVQSAQGIIDNGGLQYFFESDFPNQPPYTIFVDAYREIGASAEADALGSAVALFPFAQPHKDKAGRDSFLERLHEQENSAM